MPMSEDEFDEYKTNTLQRWVQERVRHEANVTDNQQKIDNLDPNSSWDMNIMLPIYAKFRRSAQEQVNKLNIDIQELTETSYVMYLAKHAPGFGFSFMNSQ